MIFVKASRQNFLLWKADPSNENKPNWMFQVERNGRALAAIRANALNQFINAKRSQLTDSELKKEDRDKLYDDFVRTFRDLLANRFPYAFENFLEDRNTSGKLSDDFYEFERHLGSNYGPEFYRG
jgi:hypothetical protein